MKKMVILFNKKELNKIALKRKISFDELVDENRKQILKDRKLMDQIEDKLEKKQDVPLRKTE